MSKLSPDERAKIIHLLCEGSSIRAITRMTGASKNTVAKLLVSAGCAVAEYQDKALRNLTCKRVQVDEIWSFVGSKEKNTSVEKKAQGNGDCWTWMALCADSKLLLSLWVGSRDADSGNAFMQDVASRLANRVQLTSDGHKVYLQAIEGAFGGDVDYAMLVKMYGKPYEGERRYSPLVCTGCKRTKITGSPDPDHVSTSYVERSNLTLLMHSRRFTRLTNAFSKKIENHIHAIALHCMYYNFVRIHKTLRVSPAMAAGVTSKLWEVKDIVALIEQAERQRKTEKSGT
jgi:IS1 family transposase